MTKSKITLSIKTNLYNEVHKSIPKGQISALVEDLLERELAGEFQQFKIDRLEKELASAKSENHQIQTQHETQQKKANESYNRAEEEALKRRKMYLQKKRGEK